MRPEKYEKYDVDWDTDDQSDRTNARAAAAAIALAKARRSAASGRFSVFACISTNSKIPVAHSSLDTPPSEPAHQIGNKMKFIGKRTQGASDAGGTTNPPRSKPKANHMTLSFDVEE